MDRLIAIKSFVEVANRKSFTKAADSLGLSRLQISRHVQDVESWLNQRLLHRTTRKVSLTASGEQAYIRCQRILDEAAAMVFEAEKLNDELVGTIRIASPIGLAQNMLIGAIMDFTNHHPLVVIDIIASDKFTELVDERVDIALRYTEKPDDNLIARKLMSIDSGLCATRRYLEKYGEPAHPQDLEQHNCLVHLDIKHWRLVKDSDLFEPSIAGNIRANELTTLMTAAMNDKGIVRAPCDLANPLVEEGKLEYILKDYASPSYALWAVYLSRSYQTPLVRRFIDYLVDHWQEDILRLS
ncbi:LysR family transcriptional regulator [Vibrio galatheae]|uniref:LysR family transcriptional regulator n=1 Tax=Vibrio galatheae TaxID=579748 RepID=A0A0F4NLI4_9VIBR|nr:LysR family transcriptional regulator [Vibrio galatheae]KJY83977.1 LysR family transcriptional regulator [Vibrio galatheae]